MCVLVLCVVGVETRVYWSIGPLQTVYNRGARGMLHDDRIVLAILLCRIHLKSVPK